MKTSLECMECNVKQLIKVSSFVNASSDLQEIASRKMFKLLSEISFEKTNPEIMGETWKLMLDVFKTNNPYKEIKSFYNTLLLDSYDDIKTIIEESDNLFMTSLKIAVIGNIIDFGARHKFRKEEVLERIKHYQEMNFAKDDSKRLQTGILEAKTILYIGDNCGEIVLDKLFIETIHKMNTDAHVFFGVRGGPVLNDVTIEDFNEVRMDEVATFISSENIVPGTVLKDSSPEFNTLFQTADVIIAKGQGNFESLSSVKRDHLYLLFMAKCDYVANLVGVDTMEFILQENK
jgi:hypothetical protein